MLYTKTSVLQVRDVSDFLANNIDLVKWKRDGGDMILDVGCGSGNITCEVLLPMLPNGINKVVATDISKKMISSASEKYSHFSKVEFDVLDFSEKLPLKLHGKFDHVFSFFCFHWIKDQR